MYFLPPSLRLNDLKGIAVESISFSLNTVTISFSNKVHITSESTIELIDGDLCEVFSRSMDGAPLLNILGMIVEECHSIDGERSLVMKFQHGAKIIFRGNDDKFECYHVYIAGSQYTI